MGKTLVALQSGSANQVVVVAIEGYPHLLTDGDPAAVQTAWAGTDWAATTALTGVVLELQNQQAIAPFNSMHGGGTATIHMQPDTADTFGIDVFKTIGVGETYLTVPLDRDDTTITVYDTSTFSAATAEAYIGNECFEYSAKTGTTFTASKRGKYSPFATNTGGRFGEHHRAGFINYSTNLEPVVTQQRRSWNGAWIGVWLHRSSGGVLDIKSEAQLVFAGYVDQITDDADTGRTVVHAMHVMDKIMNATLFRDQFNATIKSGMYVDPNGGQFTVTDSNGTSTLAGNPLVCVASGASGTNQFNAGYYTVGQLASTINAWLAAEKAAARISGEYLIYAPTYDGSGTVSKVKFRFFGVGASTPVWGSILWPHFIAKVFGWIDPDASVNQGSYTQQVSGFGGNLQEVSSLHPPLNVYVGSGQGTQARVQLYQASGVAVDQQAYIPPQWAINDYLGLSPVCLFQLGDNTVVMGAIQITGPLTEIIFYPFADPTLYQHLRQDYAIGQALAPLSVKQIIALSQVASSLLPALFFGTGTPGGYNDATYDYLGFGLALAIPGSLLGQAFIDAVNALSFSSIQLTVWIKEPTKFVDLIDSDLVLLGGYLVWKNQGLRFVEWSTPVASLSVLSLTEANKAEQVGTKVAQRSPTVLSSEWVKPIVKIQYGYDWTHDSYSSTWTLEDRTAIDDASGDAAEATIHARNIAPGDMPNVISRFESRLGYFTRALHRLTRSISLGQFEGYAPGDIVTVTDGFARDPVTGHRKVTARPALLISHSSDIGGSSTSGDGKTARGMSGEAEVIMVPVNRAAVYSPTAQVDETANTGGFLAGYNAGTLTLHTYPHQHTESTAPIDAAFFAKNDVITIVEIDPQTPASPLSWSRTIASIATNDITINAALAAPAFDTTKRYRILSEHFSIAQATQQVNTYDADTDGLIENAAPPYRYELAAGSLFTAENAASNRAEFVPILSYGDGKPRDVGHERALIRTINQLIDYRTAHSSPSLFTSALTNASFAGFKLVAMRPIYLGPLQASGATTRSLTVAPWMRSGTGASTRVRVTLTATRPTDTTTTPITLVAPFASAQFSSSSTTWGIATPASLSLSLSVINPAGWAWLLIECFQFAECRGLSQCLEGVRS